MPSAVTLFVDGVETAVAICNLERPDLSAQFGHGAFSGFSFDLNDLDLNEVAVLAVRHRPTSFDFFGYEITWCSYVPDNYNALREVVFPEWYRSTNGLAHLTNEQAVRHFLECGIFDDYDPCPWFSGSYFRARHPELTVQGIPSILSYVANQQDLSVRPSDSFDPAFYFERNPDLAGMPLLGHYVEYGRAEGRQRLASTLPASLVSELHALCAIDPLLASAKHNLHQTIRYPQCFGSDYLPDIAKQRYGDCIDAIVCVSFISLGGADLIATYALRAYQERYGVHRVLLIVTDSTCVGVPEWLPGGTLVFCLDAETKFANSAEKTATLHAVIGQLVPSHLLNVNSSAAWMMYRRFGAQLATELELFAYLFCFDHDSDGAMVGYISEYLPELVDVLTAVFCDNADVIERVRNIYGFPEGSMRRFRPVYTPAPASLQTVDRDERKRGNSILWIGRLARQKRPELLVEIAALMPNEHFVVYGSEGDSACSADIVAGRYSNIEYRGVYCDLDEVDFASFALFLNTPAWEGLPTILIQILGIGLPTVTSMAGGIGELVTSDTGWTLPVNARASEYTTLINRVLLQPKETQRRVAAGLQLIADRHTWDSYVESLDSAGAFTARDSSTPRLVPQRDRRNASAGTIDHTAVFLSNVTESVANDEFTFRLTSSTH